MLTREEYEAKRTARYNRLLDAAARAERESEAARAESKRISDQIPFGQPILVGHHSEGRHRRALETIRNKARKGFELMQAAEEYRSRAASIEANTAIYSDNPDAVELLGDKVAELKAQQAEMKRINAALRKGADFETLEMSEEHRKELLMIDRVQGYYQPLKKGFPPYMLTSINNKIKTAEKRAQVIEKRQAADDTEKEINGVKIEYSPSENRIRMYFPVSRVSLDLYNKLRRAGFKHSKTINGFSNYYNASAKYYAEQIANEYKA